MLTEINKFICKNHLLDSNDRVLLAVSGGIDSMVMAHLFARLEYKTAIAHCNFSLRAAESDKDEELVRQFAADHKIPFHCIKFETKAYAKKNHLSVQMAARELRYNWFEEIRSLHNYTRIAVAHNLDDNIETVLINLVRGTGLTGLSGMRPINNTIIRPLLFTTRHDITAYCLKHNIVFREDRSNADTKYTRNKIRHLVIPVLKEINPSVEATLNESAARFAELNEIVSEYISELSTRISEKKDEQTIFNIRLLKESKYNISIIFELFKQFGLTSTMTDELIKLINGKTGGYILTATHRIIRNRNEIIVSGRRNADESCYIINNLMELRKAPGIVSARYMNIKSKEKIAKDQLMAYIDSEKVKFPLTIRRWRAGDYFYPFGMSRKKKLSDYFTDRKYSKIEKENALILESDGEILWIIGDRIDNRVRVTSSTQKILFIKGKGSKA